MPRKKVSDAAQKLSELGASKGGQARANVLTGEHRKDIARRAAAARWGKSEIAEDQAEPAPPVAPSKAEMPYSMFRGTLGIGALKMECHVLSDGRRAFTQRELVRILSAGRESGNLATYLDSNPLVDKDLMLSTAFQFRVPGTQYLANGYEATQLIDICDKYLDAEEQGLLKSNQLKLARQASIILRSCAKVGIIALIDEATGYQEFRAKRELQLKLQAFIADELQEWARMFPDEFWFELARLEGTHYSPRSRPLRWGKYIMMFVYDAIDPDVGKELRTKNPNPHFKQNHHQWLKQFGRQKVHDQIQRVVTVMKLCDNMADFRKKFARALSKSPLQFELRLSDEEAA